jgi:O-antigen/teichoic acid export membrane protein
MIPAAPRHPLARATLRTSAALGVRLVIQAGSLWLVARLLGPARFGAFAGISALALTLGTLATCGTHIVLMMETSRDPARARQVLRHALPTTMLSGVALLAAYMTIALFLHGFVDLPLLVPLLIGITEFALQPLLSFMSAQLQATGRVATSQLLVSAPLGIRLLVAGGLTLAAPTDPLLLYGWGYGLATLASLLIGRRLLPGHWPRPSEWRLPTRAQWTHALGYAALNLSATAPGELDKTIALRLLGAGAGGIYAVGARIYGALNLPIGAMMIASIPRLVRETSHERRRAASRRLLLVSVAYGIPLGAILWLAAPMFAWVFGARFQGLGETIHWLALAVPAAALRITTGGIFMAERHPWRRVTMELAGIVVLAGSAIALSAHSVLAAMPLATAVSEWSMAALGCLAILNPRTRHPRHHDAV